MTKPTVDETKLIAEDFEIDLADVRAALDDEESSRVEVEDGYTLILVDIPSIEMRGGYACSGCIYWVKGKGIQYKETDALHVPDFI